MAKDKQATRKSSKTKKSEDKPTAKKSARTRRSDKASTSFRHHVTLTRTDSAKLSLAVATARLDESNDRLAAITQRQAQYTAAERGIDDLSRFLSDPNIDRNDLLALIGELRVELDQLHAEIEELKSRSQITLPDAETLGKLADAVAALNDLVNKTNAADQLLQAINSVLDAWSI